MSLITRCPACGTMFKVVPDQLRISEGWVRCGHCAEVFDAAASLRDEGPAPLLPPQAEQPQPEPPESPEQPQAKPEGLPQPAVESPVAAPESAAIPAPKAGAGPEPEPVTAPSLLMRESAAQEYDSVDPPPLYPSFPSEVIDSQLPDSQVRDSQSHRDRDDEEPDLDDVSFVRHARRKAFWRRPLVRALGMLLVVALAALLAVQYAVHDRDRLAAREPSLRPWLQALCRPLGCSVRPPRQIDSIVIESSTFSRLRSDAYRLNVTLRNQAPIAVAMPSIELTLTDTQDQPVIRRVLQPRDLGAGAVIPASSEWAGSLAMSVAANGNSGRIAGYRLLAFYP